MESREARGGLAVPINEMDAYHRLLWEAWMPSVRRAALDWRARSCEPMLRLVDRWTRLLPKWILENLLEQVILPRIQNEVDK